MSFCVAIPGMILVYTKQDWAPTSFIPIQTWKSSSKQNNLCWKPEDFIIIWIPGDKGKVLSSLYCCEKMKPREVVRREFCLLLCVFVHVAPEGGGGHHGSGGAWAEIGHDLVVKTNSGPVGYLLHLFFHPNFFYKLHLQLPSSGLPKTVQALPCW